MVIMRHKEMIHIKNQGLLTHKLIVTLDSTIKHRKRSTSNCKTQLFLKLF